VGEWALRSKVAGWEASKHESRSLETRWNLGSTQCYTLLTGRPPAVHLVSLWSNKPNCKFVYKLKTRWCIWEEQAQANIFNSHLQDLCILLRAVLIQPQAVGDEMKVFSGNV